MPRKPLPNFGTRGTKSSRRGLTVRGFLDIVRGKRLVRIEWREEGRRRTASWADTPEARDEARAFGAGVLERLELLAKGVDPTAPPAPDPLTLRELWEKYAVHLASKSRGSTRGNYLERWRKFELWKGRTTRADTITREDLDLFKAELEGAHVDNQVRQIIKTVLRVFRWGMDRDLLPTTKLLAYQVEFPRGRGKPLAIAEYSPDEAMGILRHVDPRDAKGWRGFVFAHVAALAGPRQNAARHLRWDEVNLEAGTLTWLAATDKMGEEREQPVPPAVIDALWVAYGWRLAAGYAGPYVFFRPGAGVRDLGNGGARSARAAARAAAKPDQPWTYGAALAQLRKAERAAGVAHLPYRGFHGFRRFVVTEAYARTGDLVMAGRYVGDRDLRTLTKSYLKDRPEQLRAIADHVAAGLGSERSGNQMATTRAGGTETKNAPAEAEASEPAVNPTLTTESL